MTWPASYPSGGSAHISLAFIHLFVRLFVSSLVCIYTALIWYQSGRKESLLLMKPDVDPYVKAQIMQRKQRKSIIKHLGLCFGEVSEGFSVAGSAEC